jgi:hypothetical protein
MAKSTAGMAGMFKMLGIDFGSIAEQAQGIGQTFAALAASQARCEGMLVAICAKLEIDVPLSADTLELIEQGTANHLASIPNLTREEAARLPLIGT